MATEFCGMYSNVDGLTKDRLNEISSIAEKSLNLLFIFASEAKQQQGMSKLDFSINNFTTTEYLRENSQTGGIVVWTRQRTGKAVLPWNGLKDSPNWIESERAWVTINDRHERLACCGLYMRVESPKSSDFHKSNQALLNHIAKEKAELEAKGYAVVIMGDFNARIESGPHFQFSNYPHQANNNGKLVVEFATANDLHCLNPMKWKGITEEKFTYQRDMGHQLHQSIIDYALASSTATHKTSRFSVQVGKCHISLFLSL